MSDAGNASDPGNWTILQGALGIPPPKSLWALPPATNASQIDYTPASLPFAGNSRLALIPVPDGQSGASQAGAANAGATAIPGSLTPFSGFGSTGAAASGTPPVSQDQMNQALMQALSGPPYNMTGAQLGRMQSDAQNRANIAAAVQKVIVGGASLAADKLGGDIPDLAGMGWKAISGALDAADNVSDLTDEQQRQQQAAQILNQSLNAALALPLQSQQIPGPVRGFLPP